MVNHLDKSNNPIMVDVGNKKITERTAIAEGEIIFAGIMGAKETSRLIPLSHNIPIESVEIDISRNNKKNLIKVIARVKTSAKTGVEIEALTAVSISCLTIYDMCKYLNKSIKISNLRLVLKKGGKSGNFIR